MSYVVFAALWLGVWAGMALAERAGLTGGARVLGGFVGGCFVGCLILIYIDYRRRNRRS
jgi:hypothetical protein